MLETNAQVLLSRLSPTDLVLDVGGWARPFNRAQWILDAESYETRNYYARHGGRNAQGGDTEWFSRETWVQRDICGREPWPFADKMFDFAICSHTLEDVRDPIGVCSELVRVAKRGYIEVPSREWETCRGQERHNEVGLSHHRWLIELEGSHLRFLPKFHLIHSHWRFSFPAAHRAIAARNGGVTVLWWDDSFTFAETTIHGVENLEEELAQYVQRIRPYPRWRLTVDQGFRRVSRHGVRISGGLRRLLSPLDSGAAD